MRKQRFPLDDNTPFNWRVLGQLLPYFMEFKQRVLLALMCLAGAKLASIGMPFILKHAVDQLNQQSAATQLISVPIALIVAYGSIRLMSVLLGEIRDTLFGRVTERAMRRIGLTVFDHLHQLDLEFHLNRQTGGLSRDIERGTTGISFLMRFMIFNIVPTLLEISLVIGILFTQYGVYFATVIFLAVVSYVSYSVIATNWRTRYVKQMNKADSHSNSNAIDSLLNYETVKYFGNESYESLRYDKDLADWEGARRKNRLSLFTLNGGQAFIISAAMTAMMLMAAIKVSQNQMTIGDFVLINAFTMQIFMPLNFLGFVYREIRGALANIENMFTLLKRQPKVFDLPNASDQNWTKTTVEFRQVEFHYDPKRPILKAINFHINDGQKVAVVGHSGSGKSTLIKLLFRFYDVTGGQVLLNGVNIRDLTLNSLRQHVAIVPQDTVLFNDSLFENIRYGRPTATEEEVMTAIQMAHLSDFINSLPDGLETTVGERGLRLSGGEKQRVAIARAILKNAPILVFDEATSALDSQSEQAILDAINSVSKEHTSLVIAHRLSTITDADHIIVMENGQIVEVGDHHSLLSTNGIYQQMWQTQQTSSEKTS
jgi:ATP-binding cassette subfamily B protein